MAQGCHALATAELDATLLIILDQFEEYLYYHPDGSPGSRFDAADGHGALLDSSKIESAAHAEAPHDIDIGSGEMAEMIGAEDLPPADGVAIARRITAEIARVQ